MRSRSLAIALVAACTVFLIADSAAQTATETILHSFNNNDGNSPSAGVVFDRSGNLYGTTFYGGTLGEGTVYELSPQSGGWTETVLQSFDGFGGNWPTASSILDAYGNIYGTTFFGGALGYGVAYELTPAAGGGWNEIGLHGFSKSDQDGLNPRSALAFDAKGNLYGTTPGGGSTTYGTVFQLSPDAGGGWSETILHNFDSTHGGVPYGSLVVDTAGNVYGTASQGGGSSAACRSGCGTVFELSSANDGSWTMKILHDFTKNSTDGQDPLTGLMLDRFGNLYGVTASGGAYGYGIAYELSPVNGGWKETIIHNFGSGTDGNTPVGILAEDAAGNLYGATSNGGVYGYGTVYKLAHATHGWRETILHNFNNDGSDGFDPPSGVILDASGNLYGTTSGGGAYGYGTVYKVAP